MTESEVLDAIKSGESDALDILREAMPDAEKRWKRLCKSIVAFRKDVQQHFPDAEYYTASGGFHLLLGSSHSASGAGQQCLVALSGEEFGVSISDGDF